MTWETQSRHHSLSEGEPSRRGLVLPPPKGNAAVDLRYGVALLDGAMHGFTLFANLSDNRPLSSTLTARVSGFPRT